MEVENGRTKVALTMLQKNSIGLLPLYSAMKRQEHEDLQDSRGNVEVVHSNKSFGP